MVKMDNLSFASYESNGIWLLAPLGAVIVSVCVLAGFGIMFLGSTVDGSPPDPYYLIGRIVIGVNLAAFVFYLISQSSGSGG
jgi:hypothetical protein